MAQHACAECSSAAYREALHRRMLVYGLTVSAIGLPVGLLLRMPIVWGLAVVGIVIGGIRLCLLRNRHHEASSSRDEHTP